MEKFLQKFVVVFDNFLNSGKFCSNFFEIFGCYIPIFEKLGKNLGEIFWGKFRKIMKKYFSNFRDKVGNNFGEILGKLFVSKFL